MLFLVVFTLFIFYIYTRDNTYWKKRKIKHDRPVPLFGNHLRNLLGIKTHVEIFVELYEKYETEKVIGYYKGTTPELIIKDPELIKRIMNVDFAYFSARGLGRDPKTEPLMFNVFSSDGDRWKLLRHALSPAFTSSKLKNVFPLVEKCAQKLQVVAESLALKDEEVHAFDLMARYTMEVIGACGFGITMNTINNENLLIQKLSHMIFTKSKTQMLLLALRDLFPNSNFINNVPIAREDIRIMIQNIMQIVREQRSDKTNEKKDFVDLLFELESMEWIRGESLDLKDQNGLPKEVQIQFDQHLSVAQLFIYFAAGFETSANSMSCTLHLLAFHPDIQSKVHTEIDNVLSKYNDRICFDAISEMPYLEMVLKESMRIFPSGGSLPRVCVKDYTIPELNLTIQAGVKVNIPVQALHMDEKYYENPTEFRPERFLPELVKQRHKYVYLPFGEGPRKCLGARLGILQSLTGLAALLQRFTVEPAPSSRKEFVAKRRAYLVQSVEGGLPIRLRKRKI